MQSLNSLATTAKQIIENWKVMLISKLFVVIVPKGHSAYSRKLMHCSGTSLIFFFPSLKSVGNHNVNRENCCLIIYTDSMKLAFCEFPSLKLVLCGPIWRAIKRSSRISVCPWGLHFYMQKMVSWHMLPPPLPHKMSEQGVATVPVCNFLCYGISWTRVLGTYNWISNASLFSKVALPISSPSIDVWGSLCSTKCKQGQLT